MKTRMSGHEKTMKLTMLAFLTALVIVLQLLCTVIKFGPFSITLALTPIIIGAAIYGPRVGAFLGFIFSAVVYITGLIGMDGGFILMMMDYSALGTTLLCLLKGTVAGFAAGICYRALARTPKALNAIVTSAVTPVVNTGLFALGMMTIFYGFLSSNAADGQNPIGMLFLAWIGINFVVEFVVNIALATVLTHVVDYFDKKYKKA